ncbi:MAG TPA: hypothetical protein VGQ30_06390 [Gemmatimonadaceae bacterium]|nr:hypothetical protein [Gemmatimonadaceae bacterium]
MNDELRSLGSARTRGIALLLVVAVAAGAAGGAIDRWWLSRAAPAPVPLDRRHVISEGGERTLAGGGDGDVPYSLRAVKLTPAQIEKLHALTARYRPAAESLMRAFRSPVMELNARMQREAMCVLTPQQRDDWVAWRKREQLSGDEATQMLVLVTAGRCPAGTTK